MMITGPQLQSALLSRQISAKDLARRVGVKPKAVEKWIKKGVPEIKESIPEIKESIITTAFLNDMEVEKWGARHLEMFPDTIPKDAL